MSSNSATEVEPAPSQTVDAQSAADADLVMLRGLEILREWLAEPAIVEILEQAERIRAADAARKDAA